jgi:ubiquitin-protein ligase
MVAALKRRALAPSALPTTFLQLSVGPRVLRHTHPLPFPTPHPHHRPVGKEIEIEGKKPTPHVRVQAVEGSPLSFVLFIEGPDQLVAPGEATPVASPYAGKVFECLVKCPDDYPHHAPTEVVWKLGASGKSSLFHPLVSEGGDTCRNLWTPHWGATSSLSALGTMMCVQDARTRTSHAHAHARTRARALSHARTHTRPLLRSRAAMAQPTAEAAVNQEAMALLQGAGKNIAGYVATAKAAAASLPNRQ